MKPIEWTDKLSVDNGIIDSDHKLLLKIVNKFRDEVGKFESSADAVSILDMLRSYSQKHFGREEKLQREVEFPYRDAHHNAHVQLLMKLDKLIEETKPTSGKYLNDTMGEKIGLFLHDWLINHVIENDLRMKPHVEKMGVLATEMGAMD